MTAAPRKRNDEGFSLVELAVYIVLLGIISAVVAATMLTLFRSERAVTGLTGSANDSQIFVSVLNQDVRSAREFAVRDGGTRLVASVASKTTPMTWSCVTWQVHANGSTYSIQRNGNVIVEHAQADGAAPFFATLAGVDVAQGEEETIEYRFIATDSETGEVDVRGTVSNVAQGEHGAPTHCI